MKLYIANCSRQQQVFPYRLPGSNGLVTQTVPIGGQVAVPKDLSRADIDAIVAQHARYGLVDAATIDRTKPFFGTCYSVDKPINAEALRRAIRHNDQVLTERGQVMRQEAAVALTQSMEERLGAAPSTLEMSVVEENQDRHTGEGEVVAEGVRVSKDTAVASPKKGSRQTRAKKGE